MTRADLPGMQGQGSGMFCNLPASAASPPIRDFQLLRIVIRLGRMARGDGRRGQATRHPGDDR